MILDCFQSAQLIIRGAIYLPPCILYKTMQPWTIVLAVCITNTKLMNICKFECCINKRSSIVMYLSNHAHYI